MGQEKSVISREGKLGGQPFLKGTRIRISDIAVKYEKLGYSVNELLQAYPDLNKSDIHTALAYYYRNKEDISIDLDSSTGAKPA